MVTVAMGATAVTVAAGAMGTTVAMVAAGATAVTLLWGDGSDGCDERGVNFIPNNRESKTKLQ